ncbi:3-isopropylmalate/(R)-2-methylmalate dehydratase large subunit [Blattabacterium sp. (Blatta orientalis) str. Tarazona]|uniref:3-isopropylmalate dehydratase large subunit n=1 Tax=Blattabacterium sp. (Blatta orientalis) TaxID=367806 RepID=UPI0002AD7DD0|nr:3-isopropylmalate dehydratase large subunit [Blattabacterium sp. (Blatta orientalis)]AGD97981.1 3-isopropylmalate/(R)-2-methylmalate dehydratase large subunit [Blattabacterium sp. (Blatta orientalis) str. Tarazona]
MSKSLFDKIWETHIVKKFENGVDVLYIDRHYIHEVTSPQAFLEIETRGVPVFRPEKIIATADHNVPTINQHLPISDPLSKKQIDLLIKNCKKFGITLYGLGHENHGIVHVIGPELGLTLPGMTIVCGDSHTSTHGAFGSISFGIGTSQVAMVMASQCLLVSKPKQMRIQLKGKSLKKGVTPKDVILYMISKLGVDIGTGHFIEYTGPIIKNMSMEGRMTICNMSIEMGAKGGLIAPDEITFDYLKNHTYLKKNNHKKHLEHWTTLKTDDHAVFDKEYVLDAEEIEPMITYGTNPGMGMKISDRIPKSTESQQKKSLYYMGFKSGEFLIGKPINYIFIGSCTNSRIEDLRLVASVVKGKKKADHVTVMVVPGSQRVIQQAKKEGLDQIFKNAGFEFRQPGCSACLGMNEDKIPSGEYCVSTSNRNFEGRQGPGVRTLLVSPLTASIIAIEGKIVDIKKYNL